MTTWQSPEPPVTRLDVLDWLRLLRRGLPLAMLIFGGLAVLLALRLIERPIWRDHRPITSRLTQMVCRTALLIMGIRLKVQGSAMVGHGAIVANHASWLDIFALNAVDQVYFVSKAEVAAWPGIGWLARATGTVFIQRDRRHAKAQAQLLTNRLGAGHRLLFFPEGTSTDGRQVLRFKTTLFAPFLMQRMNYEMQVQPVTVFYSPNSDLEPRFYGWWGGMDFAPHFLKVLAARRQGQITILRHTPLKVGGFHDRKDLAFAAETAVRAGFDQCASAENDA